MNRKTTIGLAACAAAALAGPLFGATRTEAIRERLASQDRDYVFVAMHRGDWRNFPENSEGAIRSSIALGADIVELDVHMTKDGRFVLNHDNSVDRTTTGKGKVHDLTLAEIRQFRMRDRDGKPTEYGVLTLEEALELTRGRILVNIDKFTKHPREILDAVAKVDALKEVLVKATLSAAKARELFGPYWAKVESGEILYMPVAHVGAGKGYRALKDSVLPGYLGIEPRKASMYEMCFNSPADVDEALSAIKAAPGAPRIWVNTLWDSLSAKHSDRAALTDPDGNWGWWLDRGATMIQSDYAAELIVYLTRKGRRCR
ncbi:MAG: glycerophosphodiester phosphodiesterase family protein [Kiritimatiellae bacterium]|nr:glycerophosphodiester phosphodiesterase family protein [Kiritimatiellia bacterium]